MGSVMLLLHTLREFVIGVAGLLAVGAFTVEW
jgi:hypothetical protein